MNRPPLIEAEGRPWPRDREGRPSSTCVLGLYETRRRFLTMTALAGAAGFLQGPRTRAAERELETTSVRLAKQKESVICCHVVIGSLPKSTCSRLELAF